MKQLFLFSFILVILVSCGRTPAPVARVAPTTVDTIPTIDLSSPDTTTYYEESTDISISQGLLSVTSLSYDLTLEDNISSIYATFSDDGELLTLKINNKTYKEIQAPNKQINISNNTITVQKGNTLIGISKSTGVPVSTLKELNNLKSSAIYSGQILKLN